MYRNVPRLCRNRIVKTLIRDWYLAVEASGSFRYQHVLLGLLLPQSTWDSSEEGCHESDGTRLPAILSVGGPNWTARVLGAYHFKRRVDVYGEKTGPLWKSIVVAVTLAAKEKGQGCFRGYCHIPAFKEEGRGPEV